MKKNFILLLLLLTVHVSLAQTFFEYDNAGNRIKRTFTPVPDLYPILAVRPTTAYAGDPITARIYVQELNEVTTSGLITVKLSRQDKVTLNFNPATTSVAGTPVQNANWTFSLEPSYYVFTSTTAINAGQASVIGLEGALSPTISPGTIPFGVVIIGGSGGEAKWNNNAGSGKIELPY